VTLVANPFTIASAAYDVGIRSPVTLAQATAIALAESGGNERAHNAVPPDDSYGLWQINMLGDLGPARRTQFGLTSNDQLYDIATNAKAMYAISGQGTNWRPWTTFQGARYWLVYPPAQAAATAVITAKGAGQAAQTVTEPITDVAGAAVDAAQRAGAASAWLSDRNNWWRIAKVMVGVLLVVQGASALASVAGYEGYSAGAGLLSKPLLKGLVKGKSE
jgi:hypothetical protein